MNIHEYRNKVLKKHNKIIDFFLLLLLSLTITGLIFIGLGEAMIAHFEDRTGELSGEIAGFISSNQDELIIEELQGQDLCDSFDFSELDENSRQIVEARCAQGPVVLEDMPEGMIDSQMNSLMQDVKPQVQAQLDRQIAAKKDSFENLKSKYPFLKMHVLNIIFAVLLLIYLLNNDLVITLHYIARKLMILVPVLFILPYMMFRLDVLSTFIDPSAFNSVLQGPIPINTNLLIEKVLQLLSSEMTLFYSQFLIYAVIGAFAGATLWFCNKHYILPLFAEKHGLLEKQKKPKK